MFIINPFNPVYFGYLILNLLLIVIITLILRKKSEKIKLMSIMSICIFNAIFWVIYKIILYIGNPELANTGYSFVFWKELPLHLCNVSLILVPIGLVLKKKWLYAYGFYVSVLGAFMAITFPTLGFYGTSLFTPHNIGFYGTHGLIIVVGILLVTLGFLKPSLSDIPFLVLILLALAIIAYDINNTIYYLTNVKANYFYVIEPEGISILELFWKVLPIQFFYMVFGIFILVVYSIIINGLFSIFKRKKVSNYE